MNRFKRAAAAILSAILLVTSIPQLRASGYASGYEEVPTVCVSGVASRDIVRYPGTSNEEVLFPPSANQIIAAMDAGTYLNLAAFAATGDWDKLTDALVPAVGKVLSGVSCNSDGTPKPDVGINWSYGAVNAYSMDSRFEFCYDWRLDPMDTAKKLSNYIEYICRETGHEKVNIVAFSMGSIITMAYIQQFGYDKIAGLVLTAPACNGVKCAGQPYNKQIEVNPLAVYRYIGTIMSDNPNKELACAISAVLYKTGVIDNAARFANKVVDNCLDRIYAEVIPQTFATMPGMWSLIPDEYYESAKSLIFGENGGNAKLIERIDNYHYTVQLHVKDIIDGVLARSIPFGIVVKYGNQITPCIDSWDDMNDGVIDTVYASFGATCSTLDGTLGDGYRQAVEDGHNHLSSDGQIDASTCVYLEQTWFVKSLLHMHSCKDVERLETYILYADTQVTISSNPSYPQFLTYDEAVQTVSPLTAPDEQPVKLWGIFSTESWVYILHRLVQAVLEAIRI